LAAQDPSGLDVYEEQLRVRLDEQTPEDSEVGFDAGGWLNLGLLNYDDAGDRTRRTLRRYALRGWASLNVHGTHKAYFRGLLDYDDWNTHGKPGGGGGDDVEEEIERAWYELDIGRLLGGDREAPAEMGLRARGGRQFSTIGTSLVLSMPLDGVRLSAYAGEWEAMALIGRAPTDWPNKVDASARVSDHQDRLLWGAQISRRLGRHRPFVYFLSNDDSTGARPRTAAQSYEYTSRYVGGGSKGTLPVPGLGYQAELVGEWGKTYSRGVTSGRDRIQAWAMDVSLQYRLDSPMRPKLIAEYLLASGDSDRVASSSATVGGNRAGTHDNAFNAFGFRDTGVAFSPRISNLQMVVLGGSLMPFERIRLFEKMEIGSKVFLYHKAKSSGAISDTTAVSSARWVGWDWDVYCNWRITSDVAWTARYGVFFPGSAYNGGDKSCRQFVYTGLVFSF
jgi:alginate export protein